MMRQNRSGKSCLSLVRERTWEMRIRQGRKSQRSGFISHQSNTERLFDLSEIAGRGKAKRGSLGIPQISAKQKKS